MCYTIQASYRKDVTSRGSVKTKERNTNMLFKLFYTFAKIGLFTFGGGYGMIAIVQDECVDKKKWITDDEFATVLTIAESTPGPIATRKSFASLS